MACPNMLSIGKIKFIFNLHNVKTSVYVDTEEAACHRCYYKNLFQKFTEHRLCWNEISLKLHCNLTDINLGKGALSQINLLHIFRTPFDKDTTGVLPLCLRLEIR